MDNKRIARRLPISSRPWFIYVALLPVFFVLLGYVVYPLISVFQDGYFVDGHFSLDMSKRFFNTASMTNLEATWNSFYISILSVITCGIVGVGMALNSRAGECSRRLQSFPWRCRR